MNNRSLRFSWVLIIAFNMVPIIGVAYYHWLPFDMFWLFWVEALVLSFFNAVRVLFGQGQQPGTPPRPGRLTYHPGPAVKYMIGRFLIFLFYSLFIIVFIGVLGSPKEGRAAVFQTIVFGNPLFNWALLLGIAGQAFYLVKYFFLNGQYWYASPNDYPVLFDGRQLVVHVAVVLGAVGSQFFFKGMEGGSRAGLWVIAIFSVAKCVFELWADNRGHAPGQP
jgi:hypothetical protein